MKKIRIWQGVVLAIGLNYFLAKLRRVDRRAYKRRLSRMEDVALAKVHPEDVDLVKVGARFYETSAVNKHGRRIAVLRFVRPQTQGKVRSVGGT